jgi:hypothetical protein
MGNHRRLHPVFLTGVNFDSTSKPLCDGTFPARGGARPLFRWRWPAMEGTTMVDSWRIQGHLRNKFGFYGPLCRMAEAVVSVSYTYVSVFVHLSFPYHEIQMRT